MRLVCLWRQGEKLSLLVSPLSFSLFLYFYFLIYFYFYLFIYLDGVVYVIYYDDGVRIIYFLFLQDYINNL